MVDHPKQEAPVSSKADPGPTYKCPKQLHLQGWSYTPVTHL